MAHAAVLLNLLPALVVLDSGYPANRSGLFGYALALPGTVIKGVTFGAHTLLFSSLAVLCGYQSIIFAIFTKTFAISEGILPEDPG